MNAIKTKINTGTPEPRRSWRREGLLALVIVTMTVVAYQPALHGGFVWDDKTHILNNGALRSLEGLWGIWFKPGATCQYYPLTFTAFWVGYHFWGLNPLGYHLLNLILHCLIAIVLWQVLARLRLRGAWLAGAIFALHPVCVMSVAWMTELKNTLSAILALTAGWAYIRFAGLGVYETEREATIERPTSNSERRMLQTRPKGRSGFHSMFGVRRSAFDVTRSRWWFYALSLVLFQLALFAKTAASYLPVSLLLVTWWRRDRLRWRDMWPLLPMLVLAAAMGRMTSYVEDMYGTADSQFNMTVAERLLVSGRAFWFYIGKLFFPHSLTFIYARWHINPDVWWQYLYPAAAAGLLAGLWLCRRRLGKGLFAAFMHFYVCTSLLVLLLVLYMTRFTFVSDHWQYFGCMSVIAVAACGMSAALDRCQKRSLFLKPVLCGTLLFVLGLLSWRQCHMYTSAETVWQTTIARNPGCFMAFNNLGYILMEDGQTDEAIHYFRRALEIQPGFADAHNNLGRVLFGKGHLDEAIREYRKALESEPNVAVPHFNLGTALLQRGQMDEALRCYEKAVKLHPNFAEAHNRLGDLLLRGNRVDAAAVHFQKALEIRPGYADAHNNLGSALFRKGQLSEAIAQYQTALGLEPGHANAHYNLGVVLSHQGQADEALRQYRIALEIEPRFAAAHNNLGELLSRKGMANEAVAHFQEVLKLEPASVVPHNNLAKAYLQNGQVPDAISQYQASLELDHDNGPALCELAWLLATWPQDTVRNGTRAVALAQHANQLSGGRNPLVLRILAAAYAECGRFSEAITTAQHALQLPDCQANAALARKLQSEIKAYQDESRVRDALQTF